MVFYRFFKTTVAIWPTAKFYCQNRFKETKIYRKKCTFLYFLANVAFPKFYYQEVFGRGYNYPFCKCLDVCYKNLLLTIGHFFKEINGNFYVLIFF